MTLRTDNADAVAQRLALLIARAQQGECDLVVRGRVGGAMRGYLYRDGRFIADRAGQPPLSDAALRSQATVPGQELTYTCVPPGSGARMSIDRDLDGIPDGDE